MVRLYFHDNKDTPDNFTEDHDSGEECSLEHLASIGVFYRKVDTQEELDSIAAQREYKNRDTVNLSLEKLGNDIEAYNKLMDKFYKEHFHEDEEIRYILDGEGYFDVRDKSERWIRAKMSKNDLLILPAGIYHRFCLTNDLKYVHAMRLFKDEPKWEAINRDENRETDARREYLKALSV